MMKAFSRVPSVEKLLPVFGERSLEARELLLGIRHPDEYDSVINRGRACHRRLSYKEGLMEALDEIAGTSGVEAVWLEIDDLWPTYEYLNTGDPYSPTLVYNRERDTIRVVCIGDVIERERRRIV